MRNLCRIIAAIIAASFMVFVSCQQYCDIDVPKSNNIIFSSEPFDFSSDFPTRVVPSVSASGVTFLWAQGDTVGIYPTSGSQLVFPVTDFGSTTSSFDGGAWKLSSEGVYYAYVPYVADIRLNRKKVPVSFTGQTQTGNADGSGLRDYVFMAASGTPPVGKDLIFNFKRLGCLLWIDMNVSRGKYNSLSISVEDGTMLPCSGTYNLLETTSSAAPDLENVRYSSSMTLELNDVEFTDDGSTLTCYMMMAPVDLSGKTVKFILSGDNGHTVFSAAGKNLKKAGATKYTPSRLDNIIDFEDDLTKSICVRQWDTNGNGELEYSEAEAVSTVTGFKNSSITSFNELRYFTSLEEISSNAFDGCGNLTSIDFPDGKSVSLGERAFYNCKKMTMADNSLSVSGIGKEALCGCNSLEGGIVLTEDIDIIPNSAFSGCKKITSIFIPESVMMIESYAFVDCASLTSLSIPDNTECGPYSLFAGCSNLENINIPSCWTNLGDAFFKGCKKFESFEVPNTVIRLGCSCFEDCSNLVSISLPESLLYIDENCFNSCSSLEAITIPSKIKVLFHGTFAACRSLSSVELPDGLLVLSSRDNGVFNDCRSLKYISLPNSLTSIGEKTFINTGLVSIAIPDSVVSIGVGAFEWCTDLKEIVLPNHLKIMSMGMLQYVPIKTLSIPSSVEIIYSALSPRIEEIVMLGTTPPTLYDGNIVPDNGCPIYVPSSAVASYKSAPIWCNYADRIQEMPGGGAGGDTGGEESFD